MPAQALYRWAASEHAQVVVALRDGRGDDIAASLNPQAGVAGASHVYWVPPAWPSVECDGISLCPGNPGAAHKSPEHAVNGAGKGVTPLMRQGSSLHAACAGKGAGFSCRGGGCTLSGAHLGRSGGTPMSRERLASVT